MFTLFPLLPLFLRSLRNVVPPTKGGVRRQRRIRYPDCSPLKGSEMSGSSYGKQSLFTFPFSHFAGLPMIFPLRFILRGTLRSDTLVAKPEQKNANNEEEHGFLFLVFWRVFPGFSSLTEIVRGGREGGGSLRQQLFRVAPPYAVPKGDKRVV